MFNKKKRFFKKKLETANARIWDLEFMRHQAMELKEEVRQELDQAKSRLSLLQTQIKNEKEKPKMEKGEFERLLDQETRLEKDVVDYKKQLDKMEVDINGAKKSSEHPDGKAGLVHSLDGAHEYKGFIASYLKKL